MDCERCGAQFPEAGNFCSNCGAPRPQRDASVREGTAACRVCRCEVQLGAAFCWNCGAASPHDTAQPGPNTPTVGASRPVVNLIEEELGGDASPRPLLEVGSEPLSLDDDGNDVSKTRRDSTNLGEEVSEIRFLLLQGFEEEAREAWRLLSEAHPENADLRSLADEVGAGLEDSEREPTVVAPVPARPLPADLPPLIETPTSPTFVEGTAPPAGGYLEAPAVPGALEPNVTPRLGINAPGRDPSVDSIQTRPNISKVALSKAGGGAQGLGARLVMVDAAGQTIWEGCLGRGDELEIGRSGARPWGDDPHLLARHARVVAAAGGVVVHALEHAQAYLQVGERQRVRDGDEYRVGESLLRFFDGESSRGTITWFPLSGALSHSLAVPDAGLIVGRENADIELPEDTFVSGAHCRFAWYPDGLFVQDLGSANGTYRRLRSGELVPHGELLLVGQTRFQIAPP